MREVDQIIEETEKETLHKYEVEREQKEINKHFKGWLEKPFPELLENHTVKPHEVIVEVYEFRPESKEKKKILLNQRGDTSESLKYRRFPVARILKAGEESGYEAGDYVYLHYFHVADVKNPEYSVWKHNEYKNSNLQKVGEEPPAYMSNYGKYFLSKILVLNPLKSELDYNDYCTLKITPSDISHKIKDVEGFIGD